MKNIEFITDLVAPYQPQIPIDKIILEINKLYHASEAKSYNQRHPEVHVQLPPIWKSMIEHALGGCSPREWRILNFGCGTGFEAEQLIYNLPDSSLAQLNCYDPSPEMLEGCQSRISPLYPGASFTTSLESFYSNTNTYNLLITNSLLHHLPDALGIINELLPLLTSDVIWLAGHEPSSRFYKNTYCIQAYDAFMRERNWKKFLELENYVSKFKQIAQIEPNPARETAKEAYQQGYFKEQPSDLAIERLVDFHVAHSYEEAMHGRGFDFEVMKEDFASSWELLWVKTYSYMGSFYDQTLPYKWRQKSHELSQKFPNDGANFSAIWQRVV